MIKVANKTNFNSVLFEKNVAVVKFGAAWCGPCKMIEPVLESVSNKLESVNIAKVDVDDDPGLAAKYKIMSLPTTIFFKDGQKVKSQLGYIPEDQLVELIETL